MDKKMLALHWSSLHYSS